MGHLEAYKGPGLWLETAVRVCRQFKQVAFRWFGSGSMSDVIDTAIPPDLRSRVVVMPPTSEVGRLLSTTTVYFQPSLVESHGIAVLEAMSACVPVVASSIGGLPESVRDGVDGYLCDPSSAECFINSIEDLLSNPALQERLGRSARERYLKSFSPQIWEDKMLMLLRERLK